MWPSPGPRQTCYEERVDNGRAVGTTASLAEQPHESTNGPPRLEATPFGSGLKRGRSAVGPRLSPSGVLLEQAGHRAVLEDLLNRTGNGRRHRQHGDLVQL